MKRQRYEGAYIRGGQNTLYMTRSDIVQTLAHLLRKHYDLQQMLREARELALAQRRANAEKGWVG